ncbi:hypothetical protein [Erwinia sorbitola]|uniref:Uncharacterized protein n=1 Tax=Erwinia sorbitola TaxID=2681984 RepID=A0A6I6EDC1_9GAMM|nr:hypothetical protein [Erwinia sorbitola]QGU86668.1 hypothetical protein GN242_05290 [Erwinia sorbitola]
MSVNFNFNQLQAVYSKAWLERKPTIAFELVVGRGCFVFMIFFSPEDKKTSGENLFVYLRHMNSLLKLKLYGSRRNGDFKVFLNERQEKLMVDELQLVAGRGNFSFEQLLLELNNSIPQELPEQENVNTLRRVWPDVRDELKDTVDEAERTILIGVIKLPDNKKPQDKTLRKLYIFTNSTAEDINDFIKVLKENNHTLKWTDDQEKVPKSFADLIIKIKI